MKQRLLISLKTMSESKQFVMKYILARVIVSMIIFIVFVGIFLLAYYQNWHLGITVTVVVILLIAVNISYVWLFWQQRKQNLTNEEDE